MISYNNAAYPTREQLLSLLEKHSDNVVVLCKNHNYQVTGKEKKKKNKEFLFIVDNQ